jgi:mannan endo-1,6-alpha-mannosidase
MHLLIAYLNFTDGTSERQNCTEKNHIQWTYNAGIHMSGVAALWNMSEAKGDTVRLSKHLQVKT